MAFVVLGFLGGSAPVDAFSTPDQASIVLNDNSGGGGNVLINGLGVNDPTVSSAVDLKTLFGSKFRSIPLLLAFRALLTADANLAEVQFVKNLSVKFTALAGTTVGLPGIAQYLAIAVGGVNVPFLDIVSPAVTGTWRMDIQLRHSTWQ